MPAPKKPKHTKKWEALYKSTMQWQRKARAKMNRLKKKGVDEVQIQDMSPVVDAKKLQGMTYNELSRYRHELNEFTDRSNRIIKTATGDAITSKEWKAYKRDVQRLNRQRRDVRGHIGALEVPDIRTQDYSALLSSKLDYDVYGNPIPPARGTQSPWGHYVVGGIPTSRRSLKSLHRGVKAALGHDYATIAQLEREKLAKAFEAINVDAVPEMIRSLTDDQIEFLVERAGIYDGLNTWYISDESLQAGRYDARDADPTGYNEYVASVIDQIDSVKAAL